MCIQVLEKKNFLYERSAFEENIEAQMYDACTFVERVIREMRIRKYGEDIDKISSMSRKDR